MRQKELEMRTNDLRVKQKHIRDLKRRLNKMGLDAGDVHNNGKEDNGDNSTHVSSHSDTNREATGLSSEVGGNGYNGVNGKNGTNGTNGTNGGNGSTSGSTKESNGNGSNGSRSNGSR